MKKSLIFIGLLIPFHIQAHSGHDHAHWLSEPIHILTALAAASVIMTAFSIGRKNQKKTEEK